MRGQMNRFRFRIAAGILVCVSFLIAAFIAEGVLRLTMKDRIILFPRFHDAVTYGDFTIRRYRPGISFWHTSVDGQWQFKINNMGFRDAENYYYEKPEAVVRVLALGDSHTSGYEVRQEFSYPEQIESSLKSHGIEVQALNTGISGFGTAEQLVYLENEGMKYNPDFVVLGFYANDFEDNIKANLFRLDSGTLSVEKTTHTPGIRIHSFIADVGLLRWLTQHSYFYSFTFNTAYEFAKRTLLSRERASIQTEFAIPTTEKTEGYEAELMRALLMRMHEVCQTHGVTLVIVDIPRVTAAGQPLRSSIPDELRDDFQKNSDVLLHSQDVFASFAGDPTQLHVPHGHRHISEAAHAIIAKAVVDAIENELLVEGRLERHPVRE